MTDAVRHPLPKPGRSPLVWLVWALGLLCAALSVVVVFETVQTMAVRTTGPLVHDRLGGCIVDHAIRIRQGLSIYAEPDDRFVPIVYTPLYYVLAAGVMSIVGEGVFACRLTSALLVAGCVAIAMALVRLTARGAWPLLALPIAAAGYSVCFFFYDAPRTDPLSSLMVLLAIWSAARFSGLRSAVALGVLLSLAYFSKQSSLAFSAVFLLGLMLLDYRRALLAGVVFGAGTAAAIGLMNWLTDGWFWTYCVFLTTQHEMPLERALSGLQQDWGTELLIPVLSCVLVALALARSRRRGEPERRMFVVLLGTLAIAAFCFTSRTRVGATVKVLMPFCLVAGAAIPAGLGWLEGLRGGERWRLGVRALAALLVSGYLLQHRFDPDDAIPRPAALALWEELQTDVERYAEQGQVWVGPWGYFTTPMRGQGMRPQQIALEDYLGTRGHSTGLPMPKALVQAIREERFAAIFWQVPVRHEQLAELLGRHYRPVGEARSLRTGTRQKETTVRAWEPLGRPARRARAREK